MSSLLDQLNDDALDFSVSFVTTDGEAVTGEFLDIVCRNGVEYAVIATEENDGYVDIFRLQTLEKKELYIREQDEKILDEVFDLFRIKNEDEFDFD